MQTYYNQAKDEAYSLNKWFEFRIDDNRILLTTRHGGWSILSDNEYNLLKSNQLDKDPGLFRQLEEVGIILTENSMKKVLRDLKQQNEHLFRYANYHVISVTSKCNLKCAYCHHGANQAGDEMDEDIARKVLDFIFNTPQSWGNRILIEGGEPLMNWDTVRYIREEANRRSEAGKLHLKFSLGTNLTLMDESIAREVAAMRMSITTSLDGPEELHDRQRPYANGKGSYADVVRWITLLKNDFKVDVHALPVITNHSLKFSPQALIDEYISIGQDEIFFKPMRPSGMALNRQNSLSMKADDFFDFWKRGVEYCLDLQRQKGINIKERNASYFISNLLGPKRPSMCHRRPCGAGVSILSYNCDGTINGCDSAKDDGFLDLGHVDHDDYKTIRSKIAPLLTLSADSIPICNSCPFMAYCNICLCCNWGYEKDIYPKIPRNFECKWQKKAFEFLIKKLLNKEDSKIIRNWQSGA